MAISTSAIDVQAQKTLSQMGIHAVNPTGIMGAATTFISTMYQDIVAFALQYGVMFLVTGGLVWFVSYKFGASTVANWAKKVVVGVFVAEVIIVLLPQLYYSFLGFLSNHL